MRVTDKNPQSVPATNPVMSKEADTSHGSEGPKNGGQTDSESEPANSDTLEDVKPATTHTVYYGRHRRRIGPKPGVRPPHRSIQWASRTVMFAGTATIVLAVFLMWGTNSIQHDSQTALRTRLVLPAITQVAPSRTTTPASASPSTPDSAPGQFPAPDSTSGLPTGPPFSTLDPVAVLKIDTAGVDQVVVAGTRRDSLRMGPGVDERSVLPGVAGNSVIAGHRTTYGGPFRNLDRMKPGDLIEVQTAWGSFTYKTTSVSLTTPDDVSVLAATAAPTLTLITCDPPRSSARRLIVKADLVSSTTNPTLSPGLSDPLQPTVGSTPQGAHNWLATDASTTASTTEVTLSEPSRVEWLPLLMWFAAAALCAFGGILGREQAKGNARHAHRVLGYVLCVVALWQWAALTMALIPEGW